MNRRDERRKRNAEELAEVLGEMDGYVARTKGLLVYRIGRRGAALLFFCLLDIVYGYSLLNPLPAERRAAAVRYIDSIAPLTFWGVLWFIAAALCGFFAFRLNDRIGFAAAVSIKMMWGLLFLGGAFVGIERAYVSAALWLCLAAWVAIIASWPEPPIPIKRRRTPPAPSQPPESTGG